MQELLDLANFKVRDAESELLFLTAEQREAAQRDAQDLHGLSARDRSLAREAMERYLRYEPERVARSRIKRLRGVRRPQYRLRVEGLRIFYDVGGSTVEVLAIVSKAQASEWLGQFGEAEP